ncbi:MAG: SulP family inorganic anion transporter [Chloroflexota bacterium]
MQTGAGAENPFWPYVEPVIRYLQKPYWLFRTYDIRNDLRPDLISGLTVAVILLPQAIAFAIIADLPPQMGLYAGIIGAIIGALWCSSTQMQTGPTNAMSLLVFGALVGVVEPGPEYIVAAGIMSVMAGFMQLLMGLARLGMLVNFVSHSVVVGFSTGAGILIAVRQLNTFFGLELPRVGALETVYNVVVNLPQAHLATTLIGAGSIILIVLFRWLSDKIPNALFTMVIASVIVFLFGLDSQGVATIGELPSQLPPWAGLPLNDLELISRISTGALAVGAIGLVQTMAISRSVAAQTGQRIDSNQEFVGQGIANIFSGLFSGYSLSGSFARTAVNFKSGARTPMAALFSGLFVLIALLTITPLAAFLPRTALAGVLIVTAYGMIDKAEIMRMIQSRGGDAIIMLVTLFGTLFLRIEFAVLTGIILSLVLYIQRTSTPRVQAVLPDDDFSHFTYQPNKASCVQLAVIEIKGDLYFGAVNHVEDFILDHAANNPGQRYLLLRMHNVNHIDFSGIHMLENIVRTYRDKGGDVFMVRVNYRVRAVMESSGFDTFFGEVGFVEEDKAIGHLFYRELDPAICIYECPHKVFKECQNLPKRMDLIPAANLLSNNAQNVDLISASSLWNLLNVEQDLPKPLILDVREPREYRRGHIIQAQSFPLSNLIQDPSQVPTESQLILVCRSGRRSRRAATALQEYGIYDFEILDGGMQEWEAQGLMEAIDR